MTCTGLLPLFLFVLIQLAVQPLESRLHAKCRKDDVEFATKVNQSAVVVLGESTSKKMTGESTFTVEFRVSCVLKGPATMENIVVTNAGYSSDKSYCQDLPVDVGPFIVFLHPSSLDDHKTFTSADFQEIEADQGNDTDHLLMRTCSLQRVLPLQSKNTLDSACPAQVSLPAHCGGNGHSLLHQAREVVEGNLVTQLLNVTFVNETTSTTTTTIGSLSTVLFQATGLPLDSNHQSHPISSAQEEVNNIAPKTGAAGHQDQRSAGLLTCRCSPLLLLLITMSAFLAQ